MIRTVEIKVYEFIDLDEKAQEKAIQWWLSCGADNDWSEYILNDALEIGLKITSFDTNPVDCEGFLRGSISDTIEAIEKNHGEMCKTYKLAQTYKAKIKDIRETHFDADCDNDLSYIGETKLIDLEQEFEKDLCAEYATMLNNEYEYVTSYEYAIDAIMANEYTFDVDGNRFN
jgi:hypothetical protein